MSDQSPEPVEVLDPSRVRMLASELLPQVQRCICKKAARRRLDPWDVSQSAYACFLRRCDQCQFTSRDAILAYLVRCATNVLRQHHRWEASHPTVRVELALLDRLFPSRSTCRSEVDETIQRIRQVVNEDEWRLICQVLVDRRWQDVGSALGITADAARMRYGRLVRQIAGGLKFSG